MLQKLAAILGIGLIFAVMSELWFYPVALSPEAIAILIAYGLLGYLFLLTLITFHVSGFWGFFLCASLFGFAIEAIPVAAFFEVLPFSIMWTSLAWHALLTITLGWYGYRLIMSRGGWIEAALFNFVLGLMIGIWNGYFWNVVEEADAVRFEWLNPEPFYVQFSIGFVLFISGHMILDRLASSWPEPARFEFRGFLALAVLTFGAGSFIAVFPLSLVFPALCALCFWKLNRLAGDGAWTNNILLIRIPLRRYGFAVFLLIGGYLGYGLIYVNRIAFETNAIYALVLGLISVVLFARSLFARSSN